MNPGNHCTLWQWFAKTSTVSSTVLCCLALFAGDLLADGFPFHRHAAPKPAIALIIDDMGNQWQAGRQIVDLPGPVACAFLPHGPHTRRLAQAAHDEGKEVMLHLPMQTMDHRALDRGALTLDMSQSEFTEVVMQDLAAVPHVSGINNHMGSLITRHPGHMHWLMQAMQDYTEPLFFVDSRTHDRSVARRLAAEQGVPNLQRDVFLDVERNETAITLQFMKLVEKARRKGTAVGIGHPYPETLAVLKRQLKRLRSHNLRLVSVNELITLKQERHNTWQASLSP